MSDVVIDWLYYSRASNGYCSLDIFQPNVWPFWAYITYTMRYITDQKSLMQILDLISCSDIPVLPVTFHWWCFSKKQCIQCREESIPIQIVADDFFTSETWQHDIFTCVSFLLTFQQFLYMFCYVFHVQQLLIAVSQANFFLLVCCITL